MFYIQNCSYNRLNELKFTTAGLTNEKTSASRDALDTPTCQLQEISGIIGHLIQLDHLQWMARNFPVGPVDLLLPVFQACYP